MQLVHSFSAKGCNTENLFYHCITFVLSCLYAKQNGFKINLHCDKLTNKYFSVAPYDNIYVDLEELEKPHNRIYAHSKFHVMDKYPLGTIHIDGDVILMKQGLIDELKFSDYDVIVQCKETKENWDGAGLYESSTEALKNCEYPEWAPRECDSMYNCGVVGINNPELKKEYFETYNLMLERFKKDGIDMHSVPDIIIEQKFLMDLCNTRGYKVKFLLDENRLQEHANEIGYQHLIGTSKGRLHKQCLKFIYKLDRDVYYKMKNMWSTLFPDSFEF
jgi:hypothetical protein